MQKSQQLKSGLLLGCQIMLSSWLFGQHTPPSDPLQEVYSYAIQGNIENALAILEHYEGDDDAVISVREGLAERFDAGTTTSFTDDKDVNEYVSLYQKYWQASLMRRAEQETLDRELHTSLVAFLSRHFPALSERELKTDTKNISEQFLLDRGFYANACSKTAQLYDLFLWQTNIQKDYEVELISDKVQVTVNLMEDPVLAGWIGYATLGKSQAGGWATKEALFAFSSTYDTTSESYKVSYLCHEGQHFQDYQAFPKLAGPDLEYRAKLVELIKLEVEFWSTFNHFLVQAAPIPDQPHPFANYKIMEQLSLKFFTDYEKDIDNWKKLTKNQIKDACKTLLETHSAALHKAGATEVVSFIDTL